MCGSSISLDNTIHRETSHRGLCSKGVLAGRFFAVHHWLPIQTLITESKYQMPLGLGGYYLLYNGEIFNYNKEIYDNDIDFLISLFDRSLTPLDFLNKVSEYDGFWSIVLISRDGSNVYFSTDPLGKKQLYYNRFGEISSEIRGIRYKGQIDNKVITEIASVGYSENTPYNGVIKAIPGMIYEDMRPVIQTTIPKLRSTDLKKDIEISIMRRLVGNERIACFVSGGLDSSIIAYHLKDIGADVSYYTIDNGEDLYVQMLEEHLNICVQRVKPEEAPLNQILIANEVPVDMGSMIPQYHLFSSVKERVVITGDGADELFGGYRRNQYYDSWQQDIHELTYYHLPRIDRMSMWFTKEARQPFLSREIYQDTSYRKYKAKQILKHIYAKKLPVEIINRTKKPLKSSYVIADEKEHRYKLIQTFLTNKL